GRRQLFAIRHHGDSVEAAFAFAHGFEDGRALGAKGEAIGGVLHVAASKDSPGLGAHRRSHTKIGIRRVSVFSSTLRRGNQLIVLAHTVNLLTRGPPYCTRSGDSTLELESTESFEGQALP